LEYSISYIDGNIFEDLNPTILAWHLSKITAPNGRTVSFNYTPTTYSAPNPIWQAGRGKKESTSPTSPTRTNAIKKAILEYIEVDSVKVELNKSIETTLEPSGKFFLTQLTYNDATYQLDSVVVRYNNERRYSYALTYVNMDRRRFLTTVIQPDGSKYSFEYYHHPIAYPIVDAVPSNMDNGPERDDYGYWNGNNSTNSFGLMSKITYPTKGYSEFTYERQQYAQALEVQLPELTRKLETASNQPDQITNRYTLYGTRIRTITNYSAASVVEITKEYIYSINTNGVPCSGVLYQSRPYFMNPLIYGQKTYVGGGGWNKNYNIDEPPVGYSYVTEKYQDGSYIRYRFSEYLDNPDQNSHTNIQPNNITVNIPLALDLTYLGINRVASNSAKRGLLIEKLIYDSNVNQKLQEQNLYKNISVNRFLTPIEMDLICHCNSNFIQQDSSYIVAFSGFAGDNVGGGVSRKNFLQAHPQVQQKIKTDNVLSEEWYRYNAYDQLSSKAIVNNSTDTLRTDYVHPTEHSRWYSTTLTAQNRLSPVIEQTTYHINSSSQNEVERIRTTYKYAHTNNQVLVPDTIQSSLSGSNQWRTDKTYDLYDTKGNVIQQTAIDEKPITYLWSYKNQYPIAKIEGATHTEVNAVINAVFGVPNTDALAALLIPNETKLQDGSLQNALPDALVTTYTYKPLVGIQSVTDPRRVTSYYEYDSFGRLQTVTKAGKVIESYDYHYKD
jgi:YD repeat-containing protein